MKKGVKKSTASKNGAKPKREASKLGGDLRRIRERIIASGENLIYSRRQLESEIRKMRLGE